MKRILLFVALLSLVIGTHAQESLTKQGWNFGALPAVTFDTDLGFQYGGLINLFNYGDGSRYPKYNHSIYLEVSRFTKGSGINRFNYDSDQLIPGLKTSLDISYLSDRAYDFYGFNGYDAVVNKDWYDDETSDYRTRMFYKYDRKLFRFKVDLRGDLAGEKFDWVGGFNLLNFKLDYVDIDKLNKNKDDEDLLPPHSEAPGLYEIYREWGIISDEDANGGFVPTLKAGIVYDTRDNEPNPMKGMWTEAVLLGSPEFLGGEHSFTKLSLIHRQYFTIVPNDLSFAYRLAYQTTLTGTAPFYYQTQLITSVMKSATSEGLGGANSLRGILRNRVVGDGVFLGNVEARWKFARFQFINNNFYLGLNAFADFGRVTKKSEVDKSNIIVPAIYPSPLDSYFENDAEAMHYSFGLGLRVAMNENFVIRCDYGMAADERDGDSGVYIGLHYLF
ncbi:BamA/TamA family outer membrane protein [Draconibacterium sp. IB214405]|uniref:Omp85 family outer membrane protein n=1 Tax=Draconibacterium sp. IB214405 TaxID=3097352 RepID=UPI002A156665|nr:BamA/TamA family outer membrane protein [Draconibacterium sp. IB214405]MDX8340280.1 BamA/TamA family outer membrane protein [Draconibacterium sp. IB214405]